MSSQLPFLIAIAILVSLIVFAIGTLFLRRSKKGKEVWREKPPSLYRLLKPIINLFVDDVTISIKESKKAELIKKLNAAGLGYSLLPEEFILIRRIGLGIGVLMFLYFYLMTGPHTPDKMMMLLMMIPLGYYYPEIWLKDIVKKRRAIVDKQFPFFLDLLVLTMRAGLNFGSATDHAVSKMTMGPIKAEFTRMLRDIRTGMSRQEALVNLSIRMDVASITNFVAAVNQADETGGELVPALIAQSKQRRTERFLLAEKKANQAPVKMLLPLVVFLFPIIFIIIFFPIIYRAQSSGTMSFFQ